MPKLNDDDIEDILAVGKVLQVVSGFMAYRAKRLLSEEQVDRADVAAASLIRVLTEIMPDDAPQLGERPHERMRQ